MTTQAESLRAAALRGEPLTPYQRGYVHGYEQALAATPPTEGLDRRLSDCEDALSTVEAAYDALAAAPAEERTCPDCGFTASKIGEFHINAQEAVHAGQPRPNDSCAALAATPPAEGLRKHSPWRDMTPAEWDQISQPPTEGLDVERLVTAFDRAGWHLNGTDYDVLVRAVREYAALDPEAQP